MSRSAAASFGNCARAAADESLHAAAALRAGIERRVRHFLALLKMAIARIAEIFVGWHSRFLFNRQVFDLIIRSWLRGCGRRALLSLKRLPLHSFWGTRLNHSGISSLLYFESDLPASIIARRRECPAWSVEPEDGSRRIRRPLLASRRWRRWQSLLHGAWQPGRGH